MMNVKQTANPMEAMAYHLLVNILAMGVLSSKSSIYSVIQGISKSAIPF